MQVRDVMTKGIITAEPDEQISQALGKMRKARINQLLVMSGRELYGIVELRKIVTRDIDPSSAKISNFVSHVPTIDANASIESAVSLLLKSGMRAVPVVEAGAVVGIISETDIMKSAREFVRGLNVLAHEIITPAICVEKNATAGKVKKIMVEKNISRVPVVDKDKIIGVIGTLDLIRIMEGKERMPARGSGKLQESGAKEKKQIEDTSIESMISPAVVVGDKNVGELIDLLKSNEEVIVKYEDLIGVITPKDVLELFPTHREQVYVQITGMQHESIEFKVKMDSSVNKFVQKMAKLDTIQFLFFHVNKIERGGKHDFYDIRARFKLPKGFFVAKAEGWQPVTVIQDVMDKLEKEAMKKYGKISDDARMKRQKVRYR
jgi:CBS domain-containing protein